jgi:GTPase SAR1 family protein
MYKKIQTNTKNGVGFTIEKVDDEVCDKSKQIYYSSQNIFDLLIAETFKEKVDNGLNVLCETIPILCTKEEWSTYARETFTDCRILQREWNGIIIDEFKNIIYYNEYEGYTQLTLYGDQDFLNKTSKIISENFERFGSYIKWMYNDKGEWIKVPLDINKLPIKEMYPSLEADTLEDYYTKFMKSSANILLLIGPPGTGKTSFIRGLLHHTKSSAIVTYNLNLLNNDSIFAEFIESSEKFMIMEDADTYLDSRSSGNTMMHRFLNVADGLVTTKNKKLVFSTNLENTNDIDPALIRPGRCYDILHFDPLSEEQAKILTEKLGITLEDECNTIAQIFNKYENKTKTKEKFGFI